MITAYHRPQSLDEAIQLISRPKPRTLPLGGGTALSQQKGDPIEVVDLQALGLNRISKRGKTLEVGAAVTLQQFLEAPGCPDGLRAAIKLEAPLNLRNAATIGGTLMLCDGRSSFVTVLLALDVKVTLMHPDLRTMALGEFLPSRDQFRQGGLITAVGLPIDVLVAFEYVARTPADRPIVGAAVAQWPSGRTRLGVCGFGALPLLAMDGNEAGGLEAAARNALHESGDPWGSADYRMDVGAILARRCLAHLST